MVWHTPQFSPPNKTKIKKYIYKNIEIVFSISFHYTTRGGQIQNPSLPPTVLHIRSTRHTYTTKDRVTRSQLIIGGALRCSRWVNSSCSTNDNLRVNLVTNISFHYTTRGGQIQNPSLPPTRALLFVFICLSLYI
jgi:hypothetical protein